MVTKLQNAYDTIGDPSKRRIYDLRWPSIRDGLRARQESEKRQADAAQAEEKRAAEARAKRQQEDRAREERLRNLEQNRWKYDGDIFELSRVIRKLVADLKRLKEQDDEDARKEKERNGWWAYLRSPIYGQVKETDEQKQERDNKRHQRNAVKRIKESDLAEKEARLRNLQDALRGVDSRIAVEKRKVADEKRRVEEEERARKLKVEQEARDRARREERERMAKWQREQDELAAKRAREARERMAKWQKEQAEQAAKKAREAQAAREAWEAQAREQAAAAAEERRRDVERLQKELKTRAEAIRRTEEAAKEAKKAPKHRSGRSTCRHAGWWPKVEGRQLCGECDTFQNRFLLQCPGCQMVACASCQKNLRGGGTWKGKGGGGAGRQYDFVGNDGYDWDDIPSYDYDYD